MTGGSHAVKNTFGILLEIAIRRVLYLPEGSKLNLPEKVQQD